MKYGTGCSCAVIRFTALVLLHILEYFPKIMSFHATCILKIWEGPGSVHNHTSFANPLGKAAETNRAR